MNVSGLRTAVVGTGWVRIATAVGLAIQGRAVVLVEHDPERVAMQCDGRIPYHEPTPPAARVAQHATGRIVPSAAIPRDGLDLVYRRRKLILARNHSVPVR